MLIEIINFNPAQYSPQEDIRKIDAAENLFKSHGKRNHLLLCERSSLLEVLKGKTVFGGSSLFYAEDILNLRQETRGLQKELSLYIVVDFESDGKYEVKRQGKVDIIHCGYGYFDSFSRCSPCNLLTENADDFDIYLKIATLYAKHTLTSSVDVNLSLLPGGGSTIKDLFNRQKAQFEPTLCMLDSDKKHPNGPMGSTASMFAKGDTDHIRAFCKAYILNAHELESLIPLKVIDDMMNSTSSTYSQTEKDKLEELKLLGDTEFRRWFDHKNGLSFSYAKELDDKHNLKFWESFFTELMDDAQDDIVIHGLGNSLLSNVVKYLNRKHIRAYKNALEPFIQKEWDELGQLLFSWGCITSQRVSKS